MGIETYSKASAEVWNFFKSHFDEEATDEFWERVIDESDRIAEKYKGTPIHHYVSRYLVLCVGVLNERAKAKDKAL